ncbi:Retron-type reverse transcriptase [Blautia obeum]|uniref:Retron-type reverse transcriptase n=1 Tax=Blautia obeum TaxID=40520 RepID=A0A174LRA8_9FIRM|nr:Retron-type reverse transcriptase [Blautia obeum]
MSLAFHAKDGFATGTVGTGTITVIVDSNVCFYMEEENLQIALEKGIIEPAVYERVIAYKERLEENQVPVIYNLRHLRKIFRIYKKEQDFFFGDKKEELYRTFKIPKKSGGYRTIEAPCERLKQIQRWIKDEIIDKLVMSEYATGFRKNLSIVDNAKKHVGKELVIGMDLKDFFQV